MEQVQSGIPLPFEWSANDGNTGLNGRIALKAIDVTLGYPGTLYQTVAMTHTMNGTYGADFTAVDGKRYIINKTVYTDGTYVTPDPNYAPGSESIKADSIAATTLTNTQNLATQMTSFQSDVDTSFTAAETKLGVPAGASVSADIAALQTTENTINTKIGMPGTTVSGDIGNVQTTATAIKAKTDQLHFNGTLVQAEADTVLDKTGYELDGTSKQAIVNGVWDELLSSHTIAGSAGAELTMASMSVSASAIASAVWNALTTSYGNANSFGLLMQVIKTFAADNNAELLDGISGLAAILAAVNNRATEIKAIENANASAIAALPADITAARDNVNANINSNVIPLFATLETQLTNVETAIENDIAGVAAQVTTVDGHVLSLSNNTSTRFVVPQPLMKPASGIMPYAFVLRIYDDLGNPAAPDSTPTITVRRLDNNSLLVNGAAMTQEGTELGAYIYTYNVAAGDPDVPLLVEATVVQYSISKTVPAVTEVTEFQTDMAALVAQVTDIQTKVTDSQSRIVNVTYGLPAIQAAEVGLANQLTALQNTENAVKAKTDNLPAVPASQADTQAVTTAVLTRPDISAITTALNFLRDEIRGPDNRTASDVYNQIDFTPIMKSNDPHLAYLDAAVSSRSTLTAAQVWAFATRTVTDQGLQPADIQEIWNYFTVSATTPGSIGKRIADFLDAAVSQCVTPAQLAVALNGLAQQASLSFQLTEIEDTTADLEIRIQALQAVCAAIEGATNRLPSSPVDTSVVQSGDSATQALVNTLTLLANAIKAKTDMLPAQVATFAQVAAIPTDPLLAGDARLLNLDAKISTRATSVDLTGIARTSDVVNAMDILANLVTGVGDAVVTLPSLSQISDLFFGTATAADVAAAEAAILSALPGAGPTPPTVAQIWGYTSRTLTSIIQPDLSLVAKTTDLVGIGHTQYANKMQTVFNSGTGNQEVIAWAEKDGQTVVGSNCTVTVKDSSGTQVWTGSVGTPNSDGVFRFVNPFAGATDSDFYVVITITVDGSPRTNQIPFFTVG